MTEAQFVNELRTFVKEYNRSGFPEPIPEPTTEQANRAASTVVSANEPLFGKERFESLNKKCAFAFYELCKQHFFVNGNKRIATYFLLRLLEIHGWMLEVDPKDLARFAEWVAASNPQDRESLLKKITVYIAENRVTLESWRFLRDFFKRLK